MLYQFLQRFSINHDIKGIWYPRKNINLTRLVLQVLKLNIRKCFCRLSGGIQGVPENTDNAQYIVQVGKLIIVQEGTPVRKPAVWVLQSGEI